MKTVRTRMYRWAGTTTYVFAPEAPPAVMCASGSNRQNKRCSTFEVVQPPAVVTLAAPYGPELDARPRRVLPPG